MSTPAVNDGSAMPFGRLTLARRRSGSVVAEPIGALQKVLASLGPPCCDTNASSRNASLLPVPTPALYALYGRGMTQEMLLGGQKVLPTVLQASAFTLAHPQLEDALRTTLPE